MRCLSAVYNLPHDLGYNDLVPRPQHKDADPAALEAFKKAPELIGQIAAQHLSKRIEVWFQDEARFGQQGLPGKRSLPAPVWRDRHRHIQLPKDAPNWPWLCPSAGLLIVGPDCRNCKRWWSGYINRMSRC